MSEHPVPLPLLTAVLAEQVHLANEEEGQRERAFPSVFRHSDAAACARKMMYEVGALGGSVTPTEDYDIAGEWVMYLGTLIHEKVQDALMHRWGQRCEVEVKVSHRGDLSSGHIDAVIRDPELGVIAYELKTKGSYGFDRAIGLNRKAYKRQEPEGPGTSAIIQGALNATAVEADLLIIGVIGLEAVSKQLASRVGFGPLDRVMAEWHYSPAEFGPWAEAELQRMEEIRQIIDAGSLPPRVAIGDSFAPVRLDPSSERADWRCVYCRFRSVCVSHGA